MRMSAAIRWARARRWLARAASVATLGAVVGRMPKTSLESIEKALWDPSVARNTVALSTLRAPVHLAFEHGAGRVPFIRREHVFPLRRLYELADVTVSPFSGLVWTDKWIASESVGSLWRLMEWGVMLHEPLLPTRALQDAEPVVAVPASGYYHWLLETMPNVVECWQRRPDARFLIAEASPGYVVDGLKALIGGERMGKQVMRADRPVAVKHMLMPEVYAVGGFTHPDDIVTLRRAFRAPLMDGQVESPTGARLYISRRRSRLRPLTGEERLEEELAAQGFQVVFAEELSFAEQIRVFHRARIIVSPHGAGLANLVWGGQVERVIELFPSGYFNDCYAVLAAQLGCRHSYVVCNGGAPNIDRDVAAKVMWMIREGMES